MANEATIKERFMPAINFTCADGTGIEKGTVLKLTDPRTAIASTAQGDPIAGICDYEKVANSGVTSVAVLRHGIVELSCSGAVALGAKVASQGHDNYIVQATSSMSGAAVLGTALESGSNGESIQVDLNIGAGVDG